MIKEKNNENKAEMIYIPVEKLFHHPNNPRKDLGDLTELSESIKQNGILQNLTAVPWFDPDAEDKEASLVDGKYYVIIGNRRLEAAITAGLKEIPCVIVNMPFKEQISAMLIENMQRSDLTVYEQAKGFQMMLNLGDSVETIAEKSGFSQTTVRSRVKLLDLDEKKFKASEARGASLFDYMELDKIKSIELKNKILEFAGTDNFKAELKRAIDKEKNQGKMKAIENTLSKFAKKIESSDGYTCVRIYSSYSDIDEIKPPKDADIVEYYYLSTSYGTIELMRKKEMLDEVALAVEKRKKEFEEYKRGELAAASKRAYELRSEFVKGVSPTYVKKHMTDLVAFLINLELQHPYRNNREQLCVALGYKSYLESVNEITIEDIFDIVSKMPENYLLQYVYLLTEDSHNNNYFLNYYLNYAENKELDQLYEFLQKFGYNMSDEEKQLQDGTHLLFCEEFNEGVA